MAAAGRFRMLRCATLGIEAVEACSAHVFPRHSHDQFGVGVIEAGAQRSHSGRGQVEAEAGDVISCNPGEPHDGAPMGDGRAWRMLYFDPAVVAPALAEVRGPGALGDEFPQPVLRDAAAAATLRALFRLQTAADGIDRRGRAEELLLTLLRQVMRERSRPVAVPTAPPIERARSLIDDDPSRAVSLAELAHACDLSRFQVLRGFVRATGLTPHAYLVQRRVELARRMIAGGRPLAEVAAACGFADQSHMTRTFVRRFGVSPGAYAAAIG